MDKTIVLIQVILKEKERLLRAKKETEQRIRELDDCLDKLLRKEK